MGDVAEVKKCRKGLHPYTPENRKLLKDGTTTCLPCRRASQQRYEQRNWFDRNQAKRQAARDNGWQRELIRRKRQKQEVG